MEPIDPPPCAQEEDATQHSIVLLAHDVVGNSTEGEGQHHKHVHSRPPSRGPMTPNRSPVIIRHTLHRALELCRHASLCQDCILNGDLQGHEASCNVDLEVVSFGTAIARSMPLLHGDVSAEHLRSVEAQCVRPIVCAWWCGREDNSREETIARYHAVAQIPLLDGLIRCKGFHSEPTAICCHSLHDRRHHGRVRCILCSISDRGQAIPWALRDVVPRPVRPTVEPDRRVSPDAHIRQLLLREGLQGRGWRWLPKEVAHVHGDQEAHRPEHRNDKHFAAPETAHKKLPQQDPILDLPSRPRPDASYVVSRCNTGGRHHGKPMWLFRVDPGLGYHLPGGLSLR
mmetsp:Transcript_5542/g.15196  ORF Transcript_5542/g.15196 Transcript_5542/m.15196 type:complete len:342 (-) Transcript_5542:10-1035(-)